MAAGEHLPVGLRRAHQPHARTAVGSSRSSSAPGKWLAAYKHESAHLNERSDITVERQVGDELRRVHFRQIVGLMARRVVTRVSEGDELATGQRVGLMKFGSRMDVFVPPECDLLVVHR